MENKTHREIIQPNFWAITKWERDSNLYKDQLGWTEELRYQSGGYTDTKEIWDHLIALNSDKVVGWDLGFFFPENQTFYYIDQMPKILYKLPIKEGEEPLLMRVEIRPQIVPEEDELMDYEKASEIWDNFTINGHDMKYILEHSVLFLST